jgi:hypothetical protein
MIIYKNKIINYEKISEKNRNEYINYEKYRIDRNIKELQKYHEKKSNKLICDFIHYINMF